MTNIFNSSTADAKTAWAIMAELGVIPHRITVAAGYRAGKNGNATLQNDNATTLGVVYEALQNLELQLNNSWYTGDGKPGPDKGDMLTTLMLFAAF